VNVGFVGLGKLGLPAALAIESRGHRVFGHDPAPHVATTLRTRTSPRPDEAGVPDLLAQTRIELRSLDDTLRDAELIFVTIQTPHESAFEGVTRLPAERRDFDYGPLCTGIESIAESLQRQGLARDVIVVSTVLPGTMRRLILPRLGAFGRLCYNPFFIAMGTTVNDVLQPELVLCGADDVGAALRLEAFYGTLHDRCFRRVTIEDAELTKVLYNTWISTKIAFANTAAELAHRCGADVDRVMDSLLLDRRRVLSPSYLRGGMGDGGACHPRDNIALSWLSRERGMSHDWFESIMVQRERHTEWLAHTVIERAAGRPIVVLGKAFKPESTIETGSPALLLIALLRECGAEVTAWDPHIDAQEEAPRASPACYVVATMHRAFEDFPFPRGSLVIDPWRFVPDREGVEVVRIGEAPKIPT
jgi:UDPglucose 6-dehydrogenase